MPRSTSKLLRFPSDTHLSLSLSTRFYTVNKGLIHVQGLDKRQPPPCRALIVHPRILRNKFQGRRTLSIEEERRRRRRIYRINYSRACGNSNFLANTLWQRLVLYTVSLPPPRVREELTELRPFINPHPDDSIPHPFLRISPASDAVNPE